MKFQYRAKRGPKDHYEGEVDAPNDRAAINKILNMGLTPIEVKLAHAYQTSRIDKVFKSFFGPLQSFRFKIFQTDVVLFFRYLSDFLNADIPVLQSLQLTRKRFLIGRMAVSLEIVEQAVSDGKPLSDALRRSSDIFSELHINMIRAGEVSGSLKETTERLAKFLDEDNENRMKIFSSLVYPFIIVCVGIVTLFVLLTWVIPRVMSIFSEMDQSIPFLTQMLMGISSVFAHFWWLIIFVSILGVMFCVRWYASESGRKKIDRTIFFIPGVGNFLREILMARFSRTLGSLLDGGVDLVFALGYAIGVISNSYIHEQLEKVAEDVAGGMPLSQAFKRTDFFSESDISMISVGEETGGLKMSLLRLASFYEKNNDRTIKVITTMIEPILILGLGLVIGFVVLAMLMPIFQMNLAIN